MAAETASLGQPVEQIEEEALIRRVRNGEHELFYDLVRPYERRVYASNVTKELSFRAPEVGARNLQFLSED